VKNEHWGRLFDWAFQSMQYGIKKHIVLLFPFT